MPLSYTPSRDQSDRDERRQGLRVPQMRPAKIFYPAANRYLPAQTVDLSTTGLRLSLPASTLLSPGVLLQIYVGSTSSSGLASKRAMTPARVVWVDRSDARLEVGLQYAAAAANATTSAA